MSTHPFIAKAMKWVKLGHPKPIWYDTVVHHFPPVHYGRQQKRLVPKLIYPEDELRRKYYAAHPMALLEAESLYEFDKNPSAPSLENAIRRQVKLMEEEGMSETASRDVAMKEWREKRAKREMEESLARAAALYHGKVNKMDGRLEELLEEEEAVLQAAKVRQEKAHVQNQSIDKMDTEAVTLDQAELSENLISLSASSKTD